MRCKGSLMLCRSPRRTLEAIVTQAIVVIVSLARSDLARSVTKLALLKSIELPGSHNIFFLYTCARWQR